MHREGWALYCDPTDENVALAAPRKHGKSSAFTDAFLLAAVLFRWRRYVVLFSASEALAIEHLGRSVDALKNNEPLRRDFGIKDFIIDTQTDIIVECTDGYKFRISAKAPAKRFVVCSGSVCGRTCSLATILNQRKTYQPSRPVRRFAPGSSG